MPHAAVVALWVVGLYLVGVLVAWCVVPAIDDGKHTRRVSIIVWPVALWGWCTYQCVLGLLNVLSWCADVYRGERP